MRLFKKNKQVIFPVAGMGTRFLPVTKEIPKEMLPILDKPLIHHGVEEAVSAGYSDIIFVTGKGKESIKNYFTHSIELEEHLLRQGKTELFNIIKKLPSLAKFSYVFQDKPLGLGHAVLSARSLCKGSSFALILPDDVIISTPTVLLQLESVQEKYGGSVLCLERVSPSETSRYGIVDADEIEPGVFKVKKVVEKPSPEEAPSNLAIMGRYILNTSIFEYLKAIQPGVGGEYQLTDAISTMLENEPVFGCLYNGRRFDCGVREGWIKATLIKSLQEDNLRRLILETLEEEKLI